MTRRLSSIKKHHRLPPAVPALTKCAYPSPAQQEAATDPVSAALSPSSSKLAATPGTRHPFSRTPDVAVAPTGRALSP